MKKFYLLTKTLLVAALLMVGANAWADEVKTTVYSNDFETSSDWTANGKSDGWRVNPGSTTANTFDSKVIGNGSGTGDMGLLSPSFGIDPEKVSIVDVEMKFKIDACTDGKSSGIEFVQPSGVTIGGGYIASGTPFFRITASASGNGYFGTIAVNGENKTTALNAGNGTYENNALNRNTTGIVVLNARFNFTTKEATYTMKKTDGTTLIASTTVSFGDATATTLDKIFIHAGKSYGGVTIDDVVVSSVETSTTYADYTVHFVDNNDATVKDDAVRSGEVGAKVNANSGDMESFIVDGNKYVYSSDGGGTTVANDGSAEFTVTYTKYVSTSYTVKAQVSGEDLETLAYGTAYLDGSTTKYWNKYINVSDKWYVADEETYGVAITAANTNVAFTATDAIDYFFEAEDMTYSRFYNVYEGTAASNGSAKTLYGDANAKTATTVAAGVYTISLNGKKWEDKADNYQIAYSVDGTNWIALGNIAYAANEEGVKSLVGAIIPTDAYIRIWTTQGAQTPRRYLDYMTLKKTADLPATENIVVTSAGYATYVSNYNLDFTSATTKAYKVSVAEKGVATMTLVDEVPAKTPVLLYVAGGNGEGEAIPVTTDAVDAVSGNDLVAGTGAAVATDDGDYTNMILNNVSGIGFYFAAGQTVATNRAYLHIADDMAPAAEQGARGMILEFADDILTGINEAAATTEAVQKEGKFVVDGKLVIFKKGMKFNANGARIY